MLKINGKDPAQDETPSTVKFDPDDAHPHKVQEAKRDPALTPLPGDELEGCKVSMLRVVDGEQVVGFSKGVPEEGAFEERAYCEMLIHEWRNTFSHLISDE